MSANFTASRKTCVVCRHPMTWRKKWALTWHGVKFCSELYGQARKETAANGPAA
jgi:hypothetical protein